MYKVKVGIVEDDIILGKIISDALTELGYAATRPAVSYTEALKMIERDKPDVLLLDINLQGKRDGIDVATTVREQYNMPFIFLTSNSDEETITRAKKVSPNAYLIKPFQKKELYTSIEICLHNFSQKKDTATVDKGNYLIKDSIFIKQGQYFHKVKLEDILYLESDNVYIYVHTVDNKYIVRTTLQNYLTLLNSPQFFRVHRSYAVNINHISNINTESLMINGKKISLGKSYRDELLASLRIS